MNIKYDLRYSQNPDLDEILTTLETAKLEPAMRRALQAKYDAMTAPLTVLEKTMSAEQLKEIGHPAWARDYTVNDLRIFSIMRGEPDDIPNTDITNYHPHGQRTEDVLYDTRNI